MEVRKESLTLKRLDHRTSAHIQQQWTDKELQPLAVAHFVVEQ